MKKINFSPSKQEDLQNKKVKPLLNEEEWFYTPESLKDAGEEKPSSSLFLAFTILVCFCFLILGGRLFQLQIFQGSKKFQEAEGNRIKETVLRAPRGIIYDKKGNMLVKNIPNSELVVTPKYLPREASKRDEIYLQIARILSVSEIELKKTAESKGLDLMEQLILAKHIQGDQLLLLETKISQLPGLSVEINPIREYPYKDLMSHVLGYTGRISEEEYKDKKDKYLFSDFIGKMGLEKTYESFLKGENGKKQIEVDVFGKPIKNLSSKEVIPGSNVNLSLDLSFQGAVTSALQKGLQKVNSQKGVAVVLNPQNGQILSLVSLPSFDNNLFAKEISPEDFSNLSNDSLQPLFNRVIAGAYPSGSTIKPFTASAGLEEGIITPQTTINDSGEIRIGDWVFPDWKAHGTVDVYKAISQSCNVFFYHVGGGYGDIKGVGAEKLGEYFKKFGFGQTTGVDLTGEAQGQIPSPDWKEKIKKEPWYLGDTYHMAIGQGDVLVTPLQMVNAIASIANGGKLYKPTFLDKITDFKGETVKQFTSQVIKENFVSQSTLEVVREGMRQAVTEGSARSLNSLPVPIAGKTGTAEFGENNQGKHAWFAGFAPFDNPQIALVILVEGGGEGSETAVPIAQEIFDYYFKH